MDRVTAGLIRRIDILEWLSLSRRLPESWGRIMQTNEIKKFYAYGLATIVVVVMNVGWPTSVEATVVTFDDLTVDRSIVADGYGGINWGGNFILFTDGYFPYYPESPNNSIYTSFDGPLVAEYKFSFVNPGQEFIGAWFSGGNLQFQGEIDFNLYYNHALVWTSSTLDVPAGYPAFLSSGYSGPVDTVGVNANDNGYFIMDNVTYTPTPVPEPGSLTLLGLGMASFGSFRWIKKRKAKAAAL